MPLHGKIVVIKRSGGDGTEFPLTAACLFGRKPECDIRIQLPQVSKEHCRIELNENKEVILTNLSVVNPTLINGKPMKQSERLKHGDLITIIDRSFRFEYPPEPTPKKSGPPAKRKSETLQVLQEHQVRDPGALVSGEKGTYSQASEQPFLKDGTNAVQSSVGDCDEGARKEAFSTGLRESKSDEEAALSPFGELYQITKQSLSAKLPQKAEQLGTPLSRRDSEKKATTMDAAPQNKASDKPLDCACRTNVTPKSGRRSMNLRTSEKNELACKTNGVLASPAQQVEGASQQGMTPGPATPKKGRRSLKSPAKQQEVSVVSRNVTPVSQKKNQLSKHQESTPGAVAQQVFSQGNSVVEDCTIIKTETTKRNKGACSLTPLNPNVAVVHGGECGPQSPACFVCTPNQTEKKYRESIEDEVKSPKTKALATVRTSPRTTAGKRQASKVLEIAVPSCGTNEGAQSKKRKNEDLEGDLLVPMLKRKRVSFGGQLSPELFDKRLPPNSPLRKGATPGRRSLSVLKKHSVLRRASVIGLIQELPSEQSNSKKQKALGSPRKSASTTGSASKTTPPAKKSPTTKHRTPSPGQLKYTMKKPGTPSKQTEAKKSLGPKSPSAAISQSPGRRRSSFNKTPLASEDFKSPIFQSQSPVSAETNSQLKSSFADAVLPPKTPTHEKKSPSAETMSLNASPGQTPIVRGRFSISRIETPSPVTDSNTTAPESSASVTPSIPLRRASLKSAKKTPKSTRSAFEVIRSRRSGAFQPNLKVVSSWADIVKFGNTKAQAEVASKKWITRKAVKIIKQKQKPPKTPVQKIKGHFSTGHAESPATFVVGKAHAKGVKPTGCAPKLVRNTALMKKNVNANEDFTGIAQIFSTPESTRQKRTDGKIHSLNTPQDVPISEISVMNTPEETGEMVVSPLSVVSSAKQGRYHNEAVIRLLKDDQDCTFMCSDSIQQETSLDVRHVQEESQQLVVLESMGKTPKQKSEPAMPLTGVKRLMRTPKRLMEQEDLTGVKRLLKTPKQQKVSEESLIGVKELLRTPKVEGQPVEDAFGVQRMMKTPKVKAVPQSCLTGVKQLVRTPKRKNEPVEDVVGLKRLMRTPKQKSEPVEDMVGLKRLMRTPKQKSEPVEDMVGLKRLMRTPKQKSQPVEDMVGLKRLMRTPKQKSQPVEDMVGLKRLMRTPKQKSQPVEDMVGLKRLLRTPKQKGKSVENKFGLVKLMNSPRQRGATAVEDYTGLQELLQEPDDSLVTRTSSKCDTSQEVTVCASPSSSVIAEIFTAEANAGSEERLELSYFQSNISKKGPKEVDTSAKENKSADAKCDPAIRGPEPNDSEVKRGKPAHGLLAPDREDACSSTVTLPVKAARGRRAKPLHGVAKSKVDENLIRSKADELKECQETINAEQEITVQSAQVEPSVKARRGRKAAVLPKNALAPVRKAGRGRMAKQADDKDVDVKTPIEMGSAETVLVSSTKAVGAHDQELVLPPPVTKPRRGKKAKSDEKDGTSRASLEANVSTKDTDSATDTEQPACPVVKSVRGRKPKTPVKEVNKVVPGELPSRRTRGAAAADSTTTITTTVYSSKPGPERNVLDSQEETMGQKLIQPNASSPETGMKPVRKTRGSRKNQNLGAAAVSACVAIDLPPKDESTHLSNEGRPVLRVVIENKTTTKRGKAAPQSETNKADESEVVEEKLAIKAEVKKGVSKRTVKWNLENVDREDVAELPSSKKRSIVTCVEIVDVPAKQDTELVTKTRRGRPPKKPTFDFSEPPVSDHHDITECAEMTPLRKRRVKSSVQHAAMDVVAPKQGTKQKAACQDTLDDGSEKSSVESPSRPSAVRRARGKAARVEEKVEASVARGQRGLVKKAAEGCHEVETPKPVGRGRKRVVRDMEPEPVSQEKRSSKRNVGIKALSADDSFAKCATRGTKSEASGVAKAKPVRHTRKK